MIFPCEQIYPIVMCNRNKYGRHVTLTLGHHMRLHRYIPGLTKIEKTALACVNTLTSRHGHVRATTVSFVAFRRAGELTASWFRCVQWNQGNS